MKDVLAVCMVAAFFSAVMASAAETASDPKTVAKQIPHETDSARDARMSWWRESRFGLFIHFGLYSLAARNEWVKFNERIDEAQYEKYFRIFNPDLFDAREWARQAKAAGMKYAVLTTKHHEGFCLWDSKFTDYKVTKTPFGRDIVREFVDAFRTEGIKVGFYYSLIDWHHPDFLVDDSHPLCYNGEEMGKDAYYDSVNATRKWSRYQRYLKDQVTELLTNYGRIDIVWYDFSYPGKYGKGRDDWDSPSLLALTRMLQPQAIVDNRMDMDDVANGCDFISPEQFKVTKWPTLNGERFPWETCQTFSGAWGYSRDETTWKNTRQCLDLLITTVAHGGNLILNIGPTARGTFDCRACERIMGFARWMRVNSRSIYGCTEAPADFESPDGTVLTYNPLSRRLYVHLFNYPAGALGVRFGDRIEYAQFLHDASEVKAEPLPEWQGKNDPNEFDTYLKLPVAPPPVEIPVVEIFLK